MDVPVPHRGRFAPSPTGPLHLGNAWAALLGWLWARTEGGEFLLRIEDLDAARSRPEAVDALHRDLAWLGLPFDGPLLVQSQRADAYQKALQTLVAQGRVYPCFCTRAEVARAASAPHGPADDGPVYPGTCASLGAAEAEERSRARTPVLRFRAAAIPEAFVDGVHGSVTQDVRREVGDFPVRRHDGVASYQLAVVVDDAASSVSHVLRGDDLLASTPRQLQLYRALGLPPPRYAHVPLLLGEDGKRLAKRAGPPSLSEIREAGLCSERVVGLLARWAGLSDGRPCRPSELVEGFSLEKLPRAPVRLSPAAVRAELARRL
jgi:glutamyl-tRNA synthetase